MSEYIRRAECYECVSAINGALVSIKERIKQLRKDVCRLEEENKELKEQVQFLEISQAELKGRMVGCLQGVKETQS